MLREYSQGEMSRVSTHKGENKSVWRNSKYDRGTEIKKLAIDFEGMSTVEQ